MLKKITPLALLTTCCLSLSLPASGVGTPQVKSISDRLYDSHFLQIKHYQGEAETIQACEAKDTALITIFSENKTAQVEIDVTVNGSPVGTLRSYYSDGMPDCRTPSGEGIISLVVPAGSHTIEASSPNVKWPNQTFTVEKCSCMLLPLS